MARAITPDERKVIRAMGGTIVARLIANPDAVLPHTFEGGHTPKGFPGWHLHYNRTCIRLYKYATGKGADRSQPEIEVKVPWTKVRQVGKEAPMNLRVRMAKAVNQYEHHGRQTRRINWPKDESAREKYAETVYKPHAEVGRRIRAQIDALLDEALEERAEVRDAMAQVAEVNRMLAASRG